MKERKYTGIKRVAGESRKTDFAFGLYLQVIYDVVEDRLFSDLHTLNEWSEYEYSERFVTVMNITEPMTIKQIREYLDKHIEEKLHGW